jgi:AcrR family transcriptional regulator
VSGTQAKDRRVERLAATRREILDAAWQLARTRGLISITMRDLGASIGMRAQSLYVYFPSKNAMYDAMFGEANEQLLTRLRAVDEVDPVARLRAHARLFVEFCVEDPVRYQLVFQRTIPGFEPSKESYRPAVELLAVARSTVAACGATGARAFDAWTAVTSGVAAQQNANDPGGRRWVRLLDDVIDMYLAHYVKVPARRQRP